MLKRLPFLTVESLAEVMQRYAEESVAAAADAMHAKRHNAGGSLVGNTAGSDLEWLARQLFGWSRLGAGNISTTPWLLERAQWDYLGLEPEAVFQDAPRYWDACTPVQKDAWRKLARIVMFIMPKFAERVGHRFLEQAEAIKHVGKEHLTA